MQILNGGAVQVVGTLKIWNTGTALLDSGILSVGSSDPASIASLDFQAGTFNLTSDNLAVGAAGLFGGLLNIQADQTINVTNLATVEADGTLAVFGGFSSGGLTNLGTAIFIDTTIGGTVNTPAGSTVTIVGNVNFTDAVSGAGGFFGPGTANFNGGYTPGDSPALVAFEGSASFGASNTLFMEIDGLTPGTEFDVLDIAGTMTAGGTLDVLLINAFTPSIGDSFDILDFGSITGNFSAVNLPTLGGGLDWDSSNLLIDGTLSVISNLLDGDLNADGFVGIADLNIVLGVWNTNVTPGDLLAGDPSGDGFVGIADLNVVLGNWNAGTPPTNNTNIPEPGTLGVLGLGVLGVIRRGRRTDAS
jgi:hypothetical protein